MSGVCDTLIAGDVSKIIAACKDCTTKLVIASLESYTAKLRYSIDDGPIVERNMSIRDPDAGEFEYQFAAGELTPGTLACRVRLFDSLGRPLTQVNKVYFKVEEG